MLFISSGADQDERAIAMPIKPRRQAAGHDEVGEVNAL
jgi:hypothetical protein